MIVCKLCSAAVPSDQTVKHMSEAHGFYPNFLYKNNINNYYTAVPVLDDWPQVGQPKKKK